MIDIAKRGRRSEGAVDVGGSAKAADRGVHGAVEAREAIARNEIADEAVVAAVVGVAADVDALVASFAFPFGALAFALGHALAGTGNDDDKGQDSEEAQHAAKLADVDDDATGAMVSACATS
jgi:hypothetical protein